MKFSSYEYSLLFYMSYMEKYHWTMQMMDETDLTFLLDMNIAESKLNGKPENKQTYIDDIL